MTTPKETIYDELQVLRCKRGDRAAFNELIGRWESRLFYYIRRLVDEEQDSWDSLQQTGLKVFRSLRGLREPRRFPAWLYRITRNTAFSHYRMKRIHTSSLDTEVDGELIKDAPRL
jgi:RNA polymerase sigma-70 factor (ECF subfamily)